MRHIIAILLQNEAGALTRVTGLISARGYNIESLSVAQTNDPTVSRVTLVTVGSDPVIAQINAQLLKLVDVVAVEDMTGGDHLARELLLIKLQLQPMQVNAVESLLRRVGGKGQCGACHQPPYYTDNLMHDLKTERFFKPTMIHGLSEVGDGAVKTFPLRGIKDSPPYLHDGRLLTLDDTVEFFNLVLGTKLTSEEKHDLVEFLRTL